MADVGRFPPLVAVTQSIAFAMPAKGNLRPETVIRSELEQCLFTDQKAVIRVRFGGALRSLRRLRRLCDLEAEAVGRCGFRRLMTRSGSRRRWGPN